MSEEGQQKTDSGQEASLSIGTTLRAAREARGLTVEAIARSLRLNPKYVNALETGDYKAFPAPPYVRVYLRAVARHLGVDPEQALATYLRQTGQDEGEQEQAGEVASAQAAARRGRPAVSWPAVVFLLLALAAMVFVHRRMDPRPAEHAPRPAAAQPVDTVPAVAQDSVPDTVGTAGDSAAAPADSADTVAAVPAVSGTDSLVLTITARKDSVWAQVFSDGRSWKGVVRSTRSRTFRAADSLNVHVGHNTNLSYTLNGAPFEPSDNKGVAVYKVTHKGVKEWSLERWKTVFEGRL